MNGLELSRRYFSECGLPMLQSQFPDLLPYLAVGFVGSGSDRFGFDDTLSRDHDFEPGFCVFLPGEDVVSRRQAFLLERAYDKLPKEFLGFRRQAISPVGGDRNGVMRTADFYLSAVGAEDGALSLEHWLYIPDNALAESTNGEVFLDNYGAFSTIRKSLLSMPEDARLKRLSGSLLLMAQSGQYNYSRCMGHGEPEAATLALDEFVRSALRAVFHLHKAYMPYYKWSFRALRMLPDGETYAAPLSELLLGNHSQSRTQETIENISTMVIDALHEQALTTIDAPDLERHAYAVNDKISDSGIRNLHILTAI